MTETQGWLLIGAVLLVSLDGPARSVGMAFYSLALIVALWRRDREDA